MKSMCSEVQLYTAGIIILVNISTWLWGSRSWVIGLDAAMSPTFSTSTEPSSFSRGKPEGGPTKMPMQAMELW